MNTRRLIRVIVASAAVFLASSTLAIAATITYPGNGGTGWGFPGGLQAHTVIIGNGTNPVSTTSPSNAGYVLTSNGVGSDPTFQAAAGGSTLTATQIGFGSAANTLTGSANLTYDGNTGVNLGTALPFALGGGFQFSSSTNSFIGDQVTNTSAGINATANYFVTNDTGALGQFGITSSNYSQAVAEVPNDVYLYSGNGLNIETDSANPIRFITGGDVTANIRMVIGSTGSVAIGTTTPDLNVPLTIDGTSVNGLVHVRNPNASGYSELDLLNNLNSPQLHSLVFGYTGSSYAGFGGLTGEFGYLGTNGSLPLAIFTGGTIRMTALANGKIGIGTTSPQNLLDLSASDSGTTITNASAAMEAIVNTNTTDNNFSDLAFTTVDSAGANINGAKISGVFTSHTAGAVSTGLSFVTRNAGTLGERVRITGAGNVGIGVSAPVALLNLGGNISAPSWTTTGIGIVQNIATYTDTTGTGTVGNEYANRLNSPQFGATNAGVTITNAVNLRVDIPTAGSNVTLTSPYALMATNIETSGNSITGASWTTGGKLFTVTGVVLTDNATTPGSTIGTRVGANIGTPTLAFFNGTSTITNAATFYINGAPNNDSASSTIITNDSALLIASNAITGGSTVQNASGLTVNAPSGAAKNFSAIFSGGNVGIGTTTPSSVLQVNGIITSGALGGVFGELDLARPADGAITGKYYTDTNGNLNIWQTGGTGRQVFYTSGTEKMTLSNGGFLGVGTSTPAAIFSAMVGGTYASQAPSNVLMIGSSTAGTATSTFMKIDSDGAATFLYGTGNTGIIIRNTFGNTSFASLYPSSVTPSASNYSVAFGSSQSNFNSVTTDVLTIGGNSKYTVNNSSHAWVAAAVSAGSANRYMFTGAADTGLTLSTNVPEFKINLAQTVQHATGALPLQQDMLLSGSTHSFVGASTLTDEAAFAVQRGSAGTNATVTNLHAIYVGADAVTGTVTNSYGLTINAATGATNNYAAQFLGGNVGVGTTSPFANLSVMAGGTFASQAASTVFAVSSSTMGNATTTLFSINSSGDISTGGGTPVASACGAAPLPNVVGNDANMTIYDGGGVITSCTITFAQPKAIAPKCYLTQQTGTSVGVTASSTLTGVVVSGGASIIANDAFNLFCVQ